MPVAPASNMNPTSAPNWQAIRDHRKRETEKMLDHLAKHAEPVIYGSNILIAIFVRPGETPGGIKLTDKALMEDRFQGKVGIVIGKGPLAFVDDDRTKFHGQTINLGDWVVVRPGETWELSFAGVPCRMLEDIQVKMVVIDPELVF